MIEQQENKPRRGRPPKQVQAPTATEPVQNKRATQERQRRRKPGSINAMAGKRLTVDTSKLDPNYEYRWINDDPGRVYQMTENDDWDIVENHEIKTDAAGQGSEVSAIVGKTDSGEGKRAFLVRKLKEWHDEDQAEKQKQVEETDEAIRRGKLAEADAEAQSMAGHAYVPEAGINYKP